MKAALQILAIVEAVMGLLEALARIWQWLRDAGDVP